MTQSKYKNKNYNTKKRIYLYIYLIRYNMRRMMVAVTSISIVLYNLILQQLSCWLTVVSNVQGGSNMTGTICV
jgi:hypothetical protein